MLRQAFDERDEEVRSDSDDVLHLVDDQVLQVVDAVPALRFEKFNGKGDRPIRLFRGAVYDAVRNTVKLTMRPGTAIPTLSRLIVRGSGSLALTDSSGRALDGNNDGQPGGDALFVLRKQGIRRI